DRGGRRKLERGGPSFLEQRRDRASLPQRLAELPLRGVAEEPDVLHSRWLVESQLRAQPGLLFDGCILADHEADRVAREVEESERDERHHRHNDGGLQNAAKDEGEHGSLRKVWFNTGAGIL